MWSNGLLVVLGLLACLLLLHHRVHADLNNPNRPRVSTYLYHHVNFFRYERNRGYASMGPLGEITPCGGDQAPYAYVLFWSSMRDAKKYLSMTCHTKSKAEREDYKGIVAELPEGEYNQDGISTDASGGLVECSQITGFFKDCYKEKLIMDWYSNEKNLSPYYSIITGNSVRGRNIQAYNILKDACKTEVNKIFDDNGLLRTKYTVFSLLDMSVRKHFGFDNLPGNYDRDGGFLTFVDYTWDGLFHNVKLMAGSTYTFWFSFEYDGEKFKNQACRQNLPTDARVDCKNYQYSAFTAQLAKTDGSPECYPLFDSIIVYGHALDGVLPMPMPKHLPATVQQIASVGTAAPTGVGPVGAAGGAGATRAQGASAADGATGGAAGGAAAGAPAGPAGPTAQPAATESAPSTFLQLAAFPLLPHLAH